MTTLCSACNAPIERSALTLTHDGTKILSLHCQCGFIEHTTSRVDPLRVEGTGHRAGLTSIQPASARLGGFVIPDFHAEASS